MLDAEIAYISSLVDVAKPSTETGLAMQKIIKPFIPFTSLVFI